MVSFKDMPNLNADVIADFFLSLSKPGTPLAITPLKLQKILYFAQGWHLAFKETPLFNDEFKAWTHGPVIPSLYHKYKTRGYLTIPRKDFHNADDDNKELLTDDQIKLLNAVWDAYGSFDGKYLEQLVHQEEPWLNTEKNDPIEKDEIKSYFTKLKNS